MSYSYKREILNSYVNADLFFPSKSNNSFVGIMVLNYMYRACTQKIKKNILNCLKFTLFCFEHH